METVLSSLNLEQLGTSGLIIAILLWLYRDERSERKYWQSKAFESSEAAQKELSANARIFDRAIRAFGNQNA